ncbi:MAG: hypothetical protein AAGE92_02825, partial [Cyanobacteria bacterium P01_G01_bin.4]
MYVITNRNLEKDKSGAKQFGISFNDEGPGILRLAEARNEGGKWTVEILDDRVSYEGEDMFASEAAFLKILERDLPEPYRCRVPRLLDVQKDDKGFVRKLSMNWLRTGTTRFTQLEFAHQAAELLTVMHDHAKVMHLDLRLDNFVLTDDGVGFVDFGSAVRIGEDLQQSPMLTSLFGEMMRTSQIQRMLGHMIQRGDVHNPAFKAAHHNVSPALDSYYLAVTINRPKHNPLFAHLIDHNKQSPQAKALTAL